MDKERIICGSHRPDDDRNGYTFSRNSTESYNFASHIHKCYEFVHILSGELLYSVEDTSYRLSPGDIIITKPEEFHSFSFPKKCVYTREWLHIYPDFLKDYPEASEILDSRKMGEKNYIPSELAVKYGLDRIFADMKEYAREYLPERDFMFLTYALQLIIKINRIFSDNSIEEKRERKKTPAQIIQSYINVNYREDITPETAAKTVYMSKIQAEREFKREMGISIRSYINLRRITRAKNLIMEGQKATSVFEKCGFKDYSTFYRTFLKLIGMTPNDFKRMQENK